MCIVRKYLNFAKLLCTFIDTDNILFEVILKNDMYEYF